MKKTLLAGYFTISFKLVEIPGVYTVTLSKITLNSLEIICYTNVLILEDKLEDL